MWRLCVLPVRLTIPSLRLESFRIVQLHFRPHSPETLYLVALQVFRRFWKLLVWPKWCLDLFWILFKLRDNDTDPACWMVLHDDCHQLSLIIFDDSHHLRHEACAPKSLPVLPSTYQRVHRAFCGDGCNFHRRGSETYTKLVTRKSWVESEDLSICCSFELRVRFVHNGLDSNPIPKTWHK